MTAAESQGACASCASPPGGVLHTAQVDATRTVQATSCEADTEGVPGTRPRGPGQGASQCGLSFSGVGFSGWVPKSQSPHDTGVQLFWPHVANGTPEALCQRTGRHQGGHKLRSSCGCTVTSRWQSVHSWPVSLLLGGKSGPLLAPHHRAGSFQSLPGTPFTTPTYCGRAGTLCWLCPR